MTKKLLTILFLCMSVCVYSAIQVTSPSSNETIAAAEEFATEAFQDPWDMNEQTDLGWFIWDVVSGSKSNLSSVDFSNGVFSASSSSTDPNISILETGVGTAGNPTCYLGKIGTNFKIDADKYTVLAIRMKLNKDHNAMLYWSRNSIYNGITSSGTFFNTYDEWAIYTVDIPSLGATAITGSRATWSGDIDSLRLDPASAVVDIDIDWIRLVEDDNNLYRTIRWTGNSGDVDIYLDNDTNEANGTLGVIAKDVSGSSYSFNVGALAGGNYYVGVKDSGGSLSYAGGYYTVNDQPYMTFTSPSSEGGNDFADVELNNAWNMNATSDLDSYGNLSSAPIITSINAQDRAGNSLGSITTLRGTNVSGSMDPIIYPLWFDGGRGATTPINADKYRILVLKMGLPGNWDLVGGSVARIYWHVMNEFNGYIELMHQSADVIIRHKSGTQVIDTIIADMKDLTLENSQSSTGWTGWVDGFRVDPHEFTAAKHFYIQSIKLAAYETADTSYTFRWEYDDGTQSSPSMSLYRDGNNSGYNGTLIKSNLDPTDESYTWNTTNVSAGTYYIYSTISDGINSNRTYARWPIVVDHTVAPTAEIELSRTSLDFGAVSGVTTDSQDFLIENTGTGTMNWSVSDDATWLSVSPPSGSGSGVVSVSVDATGLSRGTYNGTVSVTSGNATNSPQTVGVTFKVYQSGSTARPFGEFLTPTPGSGYSSSFAVTGWVLDDVGLEHVKIYSGADYVGDAVFVEGARSDIEAANPGYPQNYQAGWGYMLLSNFLPGGGNGTYTLYAKATDKEGHEVNLGSKTIVVDNANAVKPFGAIDTPTQGGNASGDDFSVVGWALTPMPNQIPTSGATIGVYVDNVKLGTVDYNRSRPDIAGLFPGYANSDGAMGVYSLDTTNYENGIHSIFWIAEDNDGNSDGIGSRFFMVRNLGSNRTASAGKRSSVKQVSTDGFVLEKTLPVRVKKGFKKDAKETDCYPDKAGVATVKIRELERFELLLHGLKDKEADSERFEGYLVVGSQLRRLPIGASLDKVSGKFGWLPGPGFVGNYQFLFLDKEAKTMRRLDIAIQSK
ncbi:MAG: hypothetical protein GY765_41965 [bacterium]|nr:hypothetical protein [bacterium]